jgi:hypothetical protein
MLKERVRALVKERSTSAVARECGVSSGALLAFLNGTCQAGTEALIRQRMAPPIEDGVE